jgi:hypothetical protein
MPTLGIRIFVGVMATALLTTACESPSEPSPVSRLLISTPTPPPGSVIPITFRGTRYYVFREEARISIPVTAASDRDVPWAQLDVFLYDGNGQRDFCGQNLVDAPSWEPLSKGQRVSVTIGGFELFRPCEVTSIRAWLHTRRGRDTGLLGPPVEDQTIASGALTVNYTFR